MSDNPERRPLLIVEDDLGLQKQLKWCLDDYQVVFAVDREAALAQVRRYEPPVVTLDLGLPPDPANASEGLTALNQILDIAPHTKIIVITGNEERENAIQAVAAGAYDFYQKPVDPDVLKLIVERAYGLYELEMENRRLTSQSYASPLEGVISASPEMEKVCRMVEKVAPTDVTVLLLGESGTGKELLARAVHSLSQRNERRFAVINCAAIPEALLESELFGHEKGAFTGAVKRTLGKFEYADRGTLFLDEIGDLPMSLQAKLLRFLQERTIERVGGREEIPVDVRIVCATHQDLSTMMQEGKFREDLFYRITEVAINIPPLRERSGDAVLLAQAFLNRYKDERSKSPRGFSEEAIKAIGAYAWPGNARELENRVKRAAIMAEGHKVGVQDLDLPSAESDSLPLNLRQVRERAEREAVQRALALCDGTIARAAELLGTTRPTLYGLMDKYGLR